MDENSRKTNHQVNPQNYVCEKRRNKNIMTRSHTGQKNEWSKGNEIADTLANQARDMAKEKGLDLGDFLANEEDIIVRQTPSSLHDDDNDQSADKKRQKNTHVIGDYNYRK